MARVVHGRRAGCDADRHDTIHAYKRHGCRCPAAREDNNAAWRRWQVNTTGRIVRPRTRLRRERQGLIEDTMVLTGRGLGAPEVAKRLRISVRTVHRYRTEHRATAGMST